jgi:hypothetical protein
MKAGRSFWVALAILFVASGQVVAQESVDAKVQRLEETIKALEARVAFLETQLNGKSAPVNVAPAPVSVAPAPVNVAPSPVSAPTGKENWRKLHKGMKEAEVKLLLGSPTRIVPFTYSVHWFYGKAWVDFDNSHKVQDWHEPN